jgi:membrane carboxypeptidase/penicillin-binding protein
MKYMGSVLKGVPQSLPPVPSGVVKTTINPLSGLPVSPGQSGVPEYFDEESVPIRSSTPDTPTDPLAVPGETPDASKSAAPAAETKPDDSTSTTP